jgi:hypothetical protein
MGAMILQGTFAGSVKQWPRKTWALRGVAGVWHLLLLANMLFDLQFCVSLVLQFYSAQATSVFKALKLKLWTPCCVKDLAAVLHCQPAVILISTSLYVQPQALQFQPV